MEDQKLEYHRYMTLDEVVGYLEGLITGFKAGAIVLAQGQESLALTPRPDVEVEVEARRKKDKEKFALELSWRIQECPCEAEKLYVGDALPPLHPAAKPAPDCTPCAADSATAQLIVAPSAQNMPVSTLDTAAGGSKIQCKTKVSGKE